MRVKWFLRQPEPEEPMIDIAAATCYADRMGSYRASSILDAIYDNLSGTEKDRVIKIKPGTYYFVKGFCADID